MNSTKTIKMKCGKCQEEFDYSVYQYINVTGDTKLKKEVVNKEVFKVCCPKCGALHHMLFPLIYVDDEKKVVFSLITNTSKIEDFKKFFHDEQEMFFKDYTCRLVIDGHELAEKILISEAGLNDKVLEVVKVYILSTSKFDRTNLRNCYFAGFHEGKIRFDVVMKDGTIQVALVAMDSYHQTYASNKELFDEKVTDWKFINFNWAFDYVTSTFGINIKAQNKAN